MKQCIVVTGAGGLVGRCITSYLHLRSKNVIPVYHNTVLSEDKGLHVQADLSEDKFYNIFDNIKVSTIVHCAAAIPQSFTGENAIMVASKNRQIDDKTIEYCVERKIRLLYVASCSVYGLNHQILKNERAVAYPVGPYAQEKYNSEEKIMRSNMYQPVVLRISSPYGIYQKHQTVLKLFLEKALNNEEILYHGSGTREQDFINVSDIAVAVETIINNPEVGGIFNIANGRSFTMKQLAETIVKTVGSNSSIRTSNQQDQQEGYKVKIDIKKAKELLGWEPRVSLEQGINWWAEYLRKQS